ncbi:MAG: alpha/beta hydrolase [Pseudomonadota bacterium]
MTASTRHLLDPELLPLLDLLPPMEIDPEGLPGLRRARDAAISLADPDEYGVQRSEISVQSADGTAISCLLYQPTAVTGTTAGYLHIHGGGYILGNAAGSDLANLVLCAKLGIVIVSVDYRLAPEFPIPKPLEDCYAGLAWLHDHAAELQVDRQRIGVGGESAGGGLAAALAIKARDAGEYAICHQHLTYPMLDNLTGSETDPGDPLVGEFVWTRSLNQFGWAAYLGDAEPAAPQVPARVDDHAGLPATWIHTVGLDLFRDENIHYAQALMAAGVAVELVVMPGACHGFQMLPGTELGARYVTAHRAALARGLKV